MERQGAIEKLKKLYAHAKSAEKIGSEQEAQAFGVKIQELLSKHKLSISDIDFEKIDETDPIEQKLVDFEDNGIEVRKRRLEWQENLALIVANAYFCKIIVISGTSLIYLVGRRTDIVVAEQMLCYMIRVAANLANKEYVKFFYKMRDAGVVEAARGFRHSYLVGFTQRLQQRYKEEEEKIKAEFGKTQTALVRLTDALTLVEKHMEKLRKDGETKKAHQLGRRREDFNPSGYKKGVEDANKLPLEKDKKQVQDA